MHTSVLLSMLLAVGATPHQDAKVTCQIRAAAAPVVVEQIAKQTGLKLASDRNMWRDYLCVSVKDVAADQLLAKVAAACEAQWVVNGDTKTLVPDYTLRSRNQAAKAAASAQGFAKSIAKLVESLDPKPKKQGAAPTAPPKRNDQEGDEEYVQPTAGPGKRLLVAYIRALGPSYFARLEPDVRNVMSSSPTRMQSGLPALDPIPYLTKWVAEHNEMFKNSGEVGEGDVETVSPEQDELVKVMKDLGLEPDRFEQKPARIDAMPSKLLLIVANRKSWGGPKYTSVSLRAYNNQGKMVLSDEVPVSDDPTSQQFEELDLAAVPAGVAVAARDADDDEPPVKAKTPAVQTKLELSEGSKTWLRAHETRRMRRGAKEDKPVRPEDLDFVANMAANEPLSTLPTDFLFDMATRNNVNVVASLPDSLLDTFAYGAKEDKIFVENVSHTYFGGEKERVWNHPMVLAKEAGWWVATPQEPERARANRIDRVMASKALTAYRTSQWLTLDAAATFSASVPEEASTTFTSWASCVLDLTPFGGIFGMGGNGGWMRIWGLLDPGSRQSLRQGSAVQFSVLPEGARKEISKKVFGADTQVMKFPPAKANNDLQIMNSMMMGMAMGSEGGGFDLADEPTEFLPNGLDMRGRLMSQSFSEPYFLASGVDISFMESAALGAEEYALFDIMSGMPGMAQEESLNMSGAKLKVGKRISMRLRAEVAPQRGLQGMLMDPEKPGDTEYTSKNLPADIQSEIERKKGLIKASPLMKLLSLSFSQMGRGGGVAPPPQ